LHPRWDLRFSSITPVGTLASGTQAFTYERRLPLHTIRGTGTSLGERHRPDGTRTSALRFTTADRLSPLGDGRGYWRYIPTDNGVRFITGFDYRPGWGRVLDTLVTRRLIGWMTAFSFDRLRLWAETGVEPTRHPLLSVLAVWSASRPRAGRCRRHPPAHRGEAPSSTAPPTRTPRSRRDNPAARIMADAPPTLDTLEAP
jgi:hypothetical protein